MITKQKDFIRKLIREELDKIDNVWYHASPNFFRVFRKTEDIGYHFGTKEQALSKMKQDKIKDFYLYKVQLIYKNPLRTLDKKSWFGTNLLTILSKNGLVKYKELRDELGDNYTDKKLIMWNNKLKRILYSSGYDSIIYVNKYEDKLSGKDSIVVFNSNQIKILDVVKYKNNNPEMVNESMFGNDVYEGRKILIPDDFAVWCMDFYAEQNNGLYDFTKIPTNIITASKKLISSYGNDVIYRGFGVDGELPNEIIFQPIKNGISWTFDEDVARAFSEKYENMGMNPFVAEINYNKLKYVVSMDVIMDNITQEQVKMLSNKTTLRYMEDYTSESEVLVFDTVKINQNNIQPLWL